MNPNIQSHINIALACLCCILGTIVYMDQKRGDERCQCDNSKVIEKLDSLDRKLDGKRIGSPTGTPLGSPLGSP